MNLPLMRDREQRLEIGGLHPAEEEGSCAEHPAARHDQVRRDLDI